MIKEIGSEFSYQKIGGGGGIKLPKLTDYSFTFSGRTSIETVIRNEGIKKVFMPSYCCDSMIEPFRKFGVEIAFYPVIYDGKFDYQVEIPKDADCFFWCNYFGFAIDLPGLDEFKTRGGIVIEDITHSFMSRIQYHEQSDYIIASLRKWLPLLSGGYVASAQKILKIKPDQYPSDQFISDKEKGMREKQSYLEGNKCIKKPDFLDAFDKANHWLAENYANMTIDKKSFDMFMNADADQVKKKRKNNARILYEGLENHKNLEFLFPYESMECPLFVPVVIIDGKRDMMRKKLIDNSIYCPVHWPRPNADCDSNLYDLELSLICDQRYDENDMQRIVDVLI